MTQPDCDGTTHNGGRNCKLPAVWRVKEKDAREYIYGACGQHLSQVGTSLLGGEQGELDMKRIRTVER